MIQVVKTKLARNVYEVRLHQGDARHYFAGFNVKVTRRGALLKVSKFIARDGSPFPGEDWWRGFAADHFPAAGWATYSRMTKSGERWTNPIAITQ